MILLEMPGVILSFSEVHELHISRHKWWTGGTGGLGAIEVAFGLDLILPEPKLHSLF